MCYTHDVLEISHREPTLKHLHDIHVLHGQMVLRLSG